MDNSQLSKDSMIIVNKQNVDEKEKVFNEIHHHLLEDEYPSNYLNDISQKKIFKQTPFDMLNKLKDTMQSPVHHPEGNAWNHTMLVVDEAAKIKDNSKNIEAFMWAALLHDIGKPGTTRNRKGRITSYDHDAVGAELTREFLECLHCKEELIESIVNLVRYHMHILYVLKDLPFANIEVMKKQVDMQELAMLCLCDRLGRQNVDRKKEEENISLFLSKCKR